MSLYQQALLHFIKFLQNLLKILPNHIMDSYKFYYKMISDIIVSDYTIKKILKSQYMFKSFIYLIDLFTPNFQ